MKVHTHACAHTHTFYTVLTEIYSNSNVVVNIINDTSITDTALVSSKSVSCYWNINVRV